MAATERRGTQAAARTYARVPAHRQRVIVKFHDHVRLPYDATVADELATRGIAPLAPLLAEFGPITIGPVITSKTADEIRALVDRAVARTPSYRPANILNYYALTAGPHVDPAVIVRALAGWSIVEVAYLEPQPLEPPVVDPSDDCRSKKQGYLNAAPDGIDAKYAWNFGGGDGAGQAIVDLEQGWNVNHEDLVALAITLISGASYTAIRHGTRTLGVIAAQDNTTGDVGIAPNVSSVRCVSQYLRDGTPVPIPQAIIDAVAVMNDGDVLLIEAHSNLWGYNQIPVEADPLVFAEIELATAAGIVVVEAAGNGAGNADLAGVDLDTVVNDGGERIFDRNVRDSHAILVGGCFPQDRRRLTPSCFGSRIDCYGWGQGVETTSTDDAGTDNTLYTEYFSGTSSASAVVAGVALAIQGLAEANLTGRLDPLEVRALVSDPALGTPSKNPAVDRIGPMPNLHAIIGRHGLNIAPDVYMRDFVGDTGDPHSDAISASPDVILRQVAVADPTAEFGEGSGTENDPALSNEALAGQDNFLYVRVRNRGGTIARDTVVTVYYAPSSTLLTPDLWTPIGTIRIGDVPTGDVLTVSDALRWPSADVPASGHYCFIALVGHGLSSGPVPDDFVQWDDFVGYVRSHSDMTWRNFNVVDNVPSAGLSPKAYVELAFAMGGAPDQARAMQLEVVGRLPRGAEAILEMPREIAALLGMGRAPIALVGRDDVTQLVLDPSRRTRSAEAVLPIGAQVPMRLLVRIPEGDRGFSYEIHVSQLFKEQEVGRVTWRLVPRRARQD